MKSFRERLKELVGPNGERFDTELADYRVPKLGDYYLDATGRAWLYTDVLQSSTARPILTRLFLAKELLEQLPAGWREEALGLSFVRKNTARYNKLPTAVNSFSWSHTPSGHEAWHAVNVALLNGTAVPVHFTQLEKTAPEPEVAMTEIPAAELADLRKRAAAFDELVKKLRDVWPATF